MSDLFEVSKEIMLITGASQGLGRQFARVLSAQGAAVVLAARQTGKLQSLEEEIQGKGGRAAAVQIVGRVTLHDRQRRDGGWRVFVELR
jgi:short-subunit dehydrogenase